MSTRSFIIHQQDDGTVRTSYVHFDGYFVGVGKMLVGHYDYDSAPHEITTLGALRHLEKTLHPSSPAHSFQSPEDGVTVAYHRDRGDEQQRDIFPSFKACLDELRWRGDIEYAYFRRNGKWWGMRVPEFAPLDLKSRLKAGNLPDY